MNNQINMKTLKTKKKSDGQLQYNSIKSTIPSKLNGSLLYHFVRENYNEVIQVITRAGRTLNDDGDIYIQGINIKVKELEDVLDKLHSEGKSNSSFTESLDFPDIRTEFDPPTVVFLPRLRVQFTPVSETQSNLGTAYIDNNRFVVKGVCKFFHEFPHNVNVDGLVNCIVLNGSNELMTFSFSIGSFEVKVGEEKLIDIFAFVNNGSEAFELLNNYRQLRFDFIFHSSEGKVRISRSWMAMAKVDISLNFIGDFNYDDQITIQSIVSDNVNSIFRTQGLMVGKIDKTALDSTDPKYQQFRDIRFNNNGLSTEADELRSTWNNVNNGLDVYIVETFSSIDNPAIAIGKDSGFSPIDGPLTKNQDDSGVVIEGRNMRFGSLNTPSLKGMMGVFIAHFIGHYLGLNECPGDDLCAESALNFMKPPPGTYTPFGTILNRQFTRAQFLKVTEHGFVKKISL